MHASCAPGLVGRRIGLGRASVTNSGHPIRKATSCRLLGQITRSVQTPDKPPSNDRTKNELEETTEKYGLEAGLFKTLTGKSNLDGLTRTEQAKQLLTQYGSAYLITSISFAAVSFAICYSAVNAGVDVSALLSKIGLQESNTNQAVGTFAIAYAAHKALSPVRFPPTVALTPVVARWLGKKTNGKSD